MEDALEEMPGSKVALTADQSDRLQAMEKALKNEPGDRRAQCATTTAMVQELKESLRPKLVLSISILVVHATAKQDSAEWMESPMCWATRCGSWRWAAAGKLARPITAKEQVSEALGLCSKCRPAMIAEDLVDPGAAFTF